uniref:Thioesterase n=1 Tax=Pseudomonas sp. 19-rlim TaxID=1084570 RepID=G3LGZ9_9PSED|nr:thioesterase [Pseudomonas sp. 19-rlim]
MNSLQPSVPPDFEQIFGTNTGFNLLTGPFYMKIEGEVAIVAFRVEEQHLNPAGTCHGAALGVLADNLGAPIKRMMGLQDIIVTPTINLSLDYIAPAKSGDWVELHASLLRRTRTLFFCQGLMYVDGQIIARTNATYMITSRLIERTA